MAAPRQRFVRALVLIVVLISALWGLAIWGHGRDLARAEKECKAAQAAASPSPSPSASPKASPSPSPSPTASASPSPTAATNACDRPGMFRLGLDLRGGLSVVLEPKAGTKFDRGSLEKAVDIIRNRVDALGVAEPDISLQQDNVLVQLPGVKRQADALKLIGTTAKLSFRPVLGLVDRNQAPKKGEVIPDCANPNTYPEDEPSNELIICAKERDDLGAPTDPSTWGLVRVGPVALQGDDVSGADAELPSAAGSVGWQVGLRLTGEGGKKFGDVTGKLACNPAGQVTRQLAIVLDKVVESHPQMAEDVQCNAGISGGNAQITGNFREKEAKDLALVLRYGALPVELVPSTTTTISPSLGREALRSGLASGVLGLGIVFLYVLIFYRGLGLVIWAGILTHAALTLGVIAILGQTAGFALSLAGIAGLIVSLGIATDSFIVYFERIKDEVHQGRTVRSSVDRAWASAWRTILAADLVTALAAVVLYFLAVGSVRGFALTLGLSTGLDLFVSRLYMHPAVWLLAQTKRFNESRRLGFGSVAGVGEVATAGGTR